MVPLTNSAPVALAFLFKRLAWPVPVVRWRAAKQIRNLLTLATMRATTTKALLDAVETSACETEVASLLLILFLTSADARPPRENVVSRIKHPSLLGDVLLQRIYGEGEGMGSWVRANATAPDDFEVGGYFLKFSTAHAPPIISTNLRTLQRTSGMPFQRQWAFEWKTLRDRLGTPCSDYPHYFGDALEARAGIMGQFWQRMRDVYLSAYLRTLAHAVCEWGMPLQKAETYCFEIVEAIAGLFEIEPGAKPAWLSDLPERAISSDQDLGATAIEIFQASRRDGMVAVSLDAPIASAVQKYARINITTHLISEDYQLPVGQPLYERLLPFFIGPTFDLRGESPKLTFDEVSSAGATSGDQAAVCVSLFPLPFGTWHGDLLSLGVAIPAPYVIEDAQVSCTDAGIDLVSGAEKLVSTTRIWNDNWTPMYPKGGSTRCGVATMMDASVLESTLARLKRRLALFVRVRVWEREEQYGDFVVSERNQLVIL